MPSYESDGLSNSRKNSIISAAIGATIIVLIFEAIWPNVIPFTLFEFWHFNGSVADVLKASWPLFVWGVGVNFFFAFTKRNNPELNRRAESILLAGCLISTFAGIFEEIIFRWIFFYNEIIGYEILNWLFFGWAGFGVFEWITANITAPLANFFTLGALEPYLLNGFGWAVAAAILTSNGKFRDGHIYQGLFGWINSWFIGMFFFYMMFQFGLFAAMLVHFLYDMFIFILVYVDAAIERARGFA